MNHRVHCRQAAGHHVRITRNARKEGIQPAPHKFELVGWQYAQTHGGDDAPNGDGVRCRLPANERCSVHFGENDALGADPVEDSRPFEGPEGAGHDDDGLTRSQVRCADFGKGFVSIRRYDEQDDIR